MKYINYTLLLLFLVFSCKEKEKSNIIIAEKNSFTNEYKLISINCIGEDYDPSICENKEKEFSFAILFSDGKTVLNFKNKNKNFTHTLNEQINNLGLKSYLFEQNQKMILVLDSFLEYGHKFYVYYIENDSIKFVGSKELNSKFDEKEMELKYNFIISEKENLINLNLGSSYEEITLNLENASLLLKDNNVHDTNKESIDFSGSWKLDCNSELLTFDVSENNVYLFLNSDNSIYINALLKRNEEKANEYTLHFVNTESQKEFYEEVGNVIDDEISKDKSIATITYTEDHKMILKWIGLYNTKTNKIQFAKDFIFLKENNNMNPISLNKCE